MLEASGFPEVDLFKRIDADVCIGRDSAIGYQILVGPSGEIIREAASHSSPRAIRTFLSPERLRWVMRSSRS